MHQHPAEFRIAKVMTTPIVASVNWNWKWARLAAALVILAGGAGCSGINYSKSVSPLDFILPGLMQNTPANPDDAISPSQPPQILAQAN